jgi:hypothetical protein
MEMEYIHQNKQLPSFRCEYGTESGAEVVWKSGHVEMKPHQVAILASLFCVCLSQQCVNEMSTVCLNRVLSFAMSGSIEAEQRRSV